MDINKSVLNKNNRNLVGKKDKVRPNHRNVKAILQKVEQLGKEFHTIIPIGDKEITIDDYDKA